MRINNIWIDNVNIYEDEYGACAKGDLMLNRDKIGSFFDSGNDKSSLQITLNDGLSKVMLDQRVQQLDAQRSFYIGEEKADTFVQYDLDTLICELLLFEEIHEIYKDRDNNKSVIVALSRDGTLTGVLSLDGVGVKGIAEDELMTVVRETYEADQGTLTDNEWENMRKYVFRDYEKDMSHSLGPDITIEDFSTENIAFATALE